MDKRIHRKNGQYLTCRHYLLHFKWPLFGVIFILVSMSAIQINSNLSILNRIHIREEIVFLNDVLYPTHFHDENTVNRSILFYFSRKDELKTADDRQSMAHRQKMVFIENSTNETKKTFLIHEFTPVFGVARFCSTHRDEIFGPSCPYRNCEYTCDKKRIHEADVLLMHKRDLDKKRLERFRRKNSQIWLLWHDESNENSPDINKYKFNWTISYRTDAEASLGAYGITLVRDHFLTAEQSQSWIDLQFKQRKNRAVWFVSNCRPQKRLKIYRNLRKFYPIAAFGRCISENESLSFDDESEKLCARQSSCENKFLDSSKFFLAFESQTCRDYITEKFWRTLSYGLIPIVSGPNRKNFERVAPPDSFLHVDDFRSEQHLAETLRQIETNRTLFGKFHQWRRFYHVLFQAKQLDPFRFCELCYRLNTNNKRIWYENINEWFLENC